MEIGQVFTIADFSCHGMTSAWNIEFLSDGNHREMALLASESAKTG